MQHTTTLNLKKPDLTDYVLISDLNENMDIIDSAIGDLKEGSTVIEELETADKTLAGSINEVKKTIGTHVLDNEKHITSNERTKWNSKETPEGAQEKANAVQNNLTTHMAEKATTTGYGHTILNPTVTSASQDEAATAGAVKAANDNANSRIPSSAINQPNGVLGLGPDGKAPSNLIPGAKVRIGEIDFGLNPAISGVIQGLENYRDVDVYMKEIFVNSPTTKRLDVKLNDNAGYLITTTGMGNTVKFDAYVVSRMDNDSLFVTCDTSFMLRAIAAGNISSSVMVNNHPVLTNDTNKPVRFSKVTIMIDASTVISGGKIEAWGVPR